MSEHVSKQSRVPPQTNGPKGKKTLVNLSSKTLSEDELSILNKGLKFCPTQKKVDAGKKRSELDKFHNKLRTKQFFEREQHKSAKSKPIDNAKRTVYGNTPFNNIQKLLKLKKPSSWRAPTGSPSLETFINMNEIKLNNSNMPKIKKQNITEGERKALKNLAKDREITIKPADKGGAIVIMDTRDYIIEAKRQLHDKNTYRALDKDPTKTYSQEVNSKIDQMVKDNEITQKIGELLKVKNPRTPQIYFLPKIHKQTNPPPGRPIVSANSCPTENISAFVDVFLNPLVSKTEHYVKDTTDFLNKIREIGVVSPTTILGTLDVTSLYTNIPNKEGLDSIEETLKEKRPMNENPKNKSLTELLSLVLNRNNFQFNNQNYLQIGGTAMGTRVAPSYANLFMNKIETNLLAGFYLKPTTWLRYIDDIFFIWEHGEQNLKNWYKYLNQSHRTIKFTMEKSKESIHFLDTTVRKDKNNILYTDLYTKPTDSHNYLRYDSAHPPHCKRGLPYGQFLRLRRMCTQESDFEKHATAMKQNFIERGYPKKQLNENVKKCTQTNRVDLLEPKKRDIETTNEDKTFIVQTFRPCKNSLVQTIKENWDILGRSKETKQIHRSKLICSFKKPKSIKDHLVRARTDYNEETDGQMPSNQTKAITKNICKKQKCKYCDMISTSGVITSKQTKEKHTTKHNVTCNSSNVIYCIECTNCKIQYVGQTKRKIKERIREHLYYTKKQIYKSDVPYHFNGAKCTIDNIQVHITDFIYEHPESKRAKSLRLTLEHNWVSRLRTQAPNGLNTLDNRYG